MKPRFTLAAALVLTACGSGGGNKAADGNAAAAGPAAAPAAPTSASGAAEMAQMQPGQWEISMAMEGAALPATRTCVTAEDVARGSAAMLSGGGNRHGIACDYSHVTLAGGRIQGTSSCSRPGMEMSMTMDGTMSPTAYDVNQQIRSTMHGRTRESSGHMIGRRIGECEPGQARARGAGE